MQKYSILLVIIILSVVAALSIWGPHKKPSPEKLMQQYGRKLSAEELRAIPDTYFELKNGKRLWGAPKDEPELLSHGSITTGSSGGVHWYRYQKSIQSIDEYIEFVKTHNPVPAFEWIRNFRKSDVAAGADTSRITKADINWDVARARTKTVAVKSLTAYSLELQSSPTSRRQLVVFSDGVVYTNVQTEK